MRIDTSYLDVFLTYLELEKGFSVHTISAYRLDCGRFLDSRTTGQSSRHPETGSPGRSSADLSTISETQIFDFIVTERKAGKSVSTVRRAQSAIKTFCRFLVREKVLASNPAEHLENPKMWKYLPTVLQVADIDRLMAAIEDNPSRYPLRDKALLELTYATGMRVSEVCGLNTDSIRKDLGILKCLGKGSRERIVPVSQTCLVAVGRYERDERPHLARKRNSDLLFLSRGGRALGREVVAAMLKKYAALAGLTGSVSPHTLRHSMATHLIQGGADLRIVQEILGHVNVETTEIYTHIDRSELKEAHRKYHPRG